MACIDPTDETIDEELAQYRAVAEMLAVCETSTEGLVDLCEWLAGRYETLLSENLQMDLFAYAELQHLRSDMERWRVEFYHPNYKSLKGTPRL